MRQATVGMVCFFWGGKEGEEGRGREEKIEGDRRKIEDNSFE